MVRVTEFEMAEMHTHRGDGAVFLWNLSAFFLRSALVEIFPDLYNFPDTHTIIVVTPLTYALHVDMPPV